MKKLNKYHGVVVPMVTPVTKDGDIDVKAVERIIDNFAKHGVSALLMGTTGEGHSVSTDQGVKMIEAAAKAAAGRIVIYTGLAGNCVSEQMAMLLRINCGSNAQILHRPCKCSHCTTNALQHNNNHAHEHSVGCN